MPAPPAIGVYAFRVAGGCAIERVRGASDIIYLGQGEIQKRLDAHASPDWKDWDDTGWRICWVACARKLEVAWACLPKELATQKERELLEEYLLDHCELPPANRRLDTPSQQSRLMIMAESVFYLLDAEQLRVLVDFINALIHKKGVGSHID